MLYEGARYRILANQESTLPSRQKLQLIITFFVCRTYCKAWNEKQKHKLNVELDLQKFFWAPCAQLYSLAEIPNPHPFPRIWAHIRGRYWPRKTTSLCYPLSRTDYFFGFSFWCSIVCIAKTQYPKFETNIPRKGIARPQSQFPHSCVCEHFIYCTSSVIHQQMHYTID